MMTDTSILGYTSEALREMTPDERRAVMVDLLNHTVDMLEQIPGAFARDLKEHGEELEAPIKSCADGVKWIAHRLRDHGTFGPL